MTSDGPILRNGRVEGEELSGYWLDGLGDVPYSHGMSDVSQSSAVDPAILARLRCPLTRSRLRQEGEFLVAEVGGLRYPVREGFPVLLTEEAKLPAPFKTLDEFKAHHKSVIPK